MPLFLSSSTYRRYNVVDKHSRKSHFAQNVFGPKKQGIICGRILAGGGVALVSSLSMVRDWNDRIKDFAHLRSPLIATDRNVALWGKRRDPEMKMNTTEVIRHWGYPVEEHVVETPDGYLLTLQRIPHGIAGSPSEANVTSKQKPAVLLTHCLDCSSFVWVSNLPYQSAAFMLADAGYDVWLGNNRGNTESRKHISLNPDKDSKFWEFTYDEMAEYDLAAMVNRVLNVTGEESIDYIGHSQGSMIGFGKFSEDLELAKKIKKFFAIGPVSTLKHVSGGLRFLSKFEKEISFVLNLVGYDEFLPNNLFMKLAAKYVCGFVFTNPLCTNFLFLVAGPDGHQLNSTRMPVYLSHTPAGTSTRNLVHYAQMVNSGLFQKYNFGSKSANMQRYGQEEPPLYPVERMEVPVYLFYSKSDILADIEDVEMLIPRLKNLKGNYNLYGFNHLDFIWGLNAAPQVYQKIIDTMKGGN